MKNRILRLMCIFCALSILTLQLPASAEGTDAGKMASVYGYVLDDYIRTYGVISDEFPNGSPSSGEGATGVVYGDMVSLDNNMPPYLLIYLTEEKYHTASCHIWKYNAEARKAERVAILEKDYDKIIETNGEFGLGWTDEKRYIVYKEYRNGQPCSAEYYTAVGDDAFMYVNNPIYANEVGIMDFNRYYFHTGVDVSGYNKALSLFYDSLKNKTADSIELENFADRLSAEDEDVLENTASKVVGFKSFDISDCNSTAEYEQAVKSPETEDRFYLITHVYNLGDAIYYLRFSTNRSYYNYALLRKTDAVPDGYQILKVRTDCIPLSGSELDDIKESYKKNNLLYKKSKKALKAQKTSETKPEKEPKIKIKKVFDKRVRIPAACIGGAVVLSLLTLLWIKLYSDD